MKCAICGREINGFGNNPWPIRTAEEARCCDGCNSEFVIPIRIVTVGADANRVETIAERLNALSVSELRSLLAK